MAIHLWTQEKLQREKNTEQKLNNRSNPNSIKKLLNSQTDNKMSNKALLCP